jgi:Zn-dependent peptidase ImmA (M78 family)/DNA-binding XRE family transcriptional regulator
MATRIKALVKPEILVWARNSAGFNLSEAAAKIDVAEEKLAGWEAGEDAPSIPQLRKIATVYKRPLAVFYLQTVPAGFQVLRDLRRLPGSGFRRLPPALTLEVRRAIQRRELALELVNDLGQEFPAFTLQADRTEDPEVVGARIRDAFAITNDEQARWRDPDGRAAFNGWRNRIEDAGVLVFQATTFDAEEASGFAVAEDRAPLIVVNRKDPPTRRSFSLLHELAHLMLHVSGVSDSHTDDARPPEDQAIEVFCNHVAAAALIPKGWLLNEARVVTRGARATTWTDGEIADLARTFSVSREALVRRLLTFGRTTDAFYRQKRGQYVAEYLAQRQRQREETSGEGIPRNMPQETVSNFGGPLVRMILGNYYQDRLTLSDVAGYLGIKTKHIPKIEQMAGF